jgi:hypothetical protein
MTPDAKGSGAEAGALSLPQAGDDPSLERVRELFTQTLETAQMQRRGQGAASQRAMVAPQGQESGEEGQPDMPLAMFEELAARVRQQVQADFGTEAGKDAVGASKREVLPKGILSSLPQEDGLVLFQQSYTVSVTVMGSRSRCWR